MDVRIHKLNMLHNGGIRKKDASEETREYVTMDSQSFNWTSSLRNEIRNIKKF